MKKIIAAAAGLMLVGTMATAASAVESQFNGAWRVRAYTQVDFDGMDSGSFAKTDTRTRLKYTAKFNENFSFVNQFEYGDITFGDNDGGDLGADGKLFEVKNSYADFTTGNVRFKVGIQGATLNRGFLFADDGSGIYAGAQAGDMALLQFLWLKVDEKEVATSTLRVDDDNGDLVADATDGDGLLNDGSVKTFEAERDYYAFLPILSVSDALTITPTFVYANTEGTDSDQWWAGADVDFSMDGMSVWFTGIYNGGDFGDGADKEDISSFLVAAGGSVGMFHGEVFYATGDDDDTDGDYDAFIAPAGSSYYWAEIMGYGTFDNQESAGSPEDNISNIFAANVGVKTKVSDKLTIGGDIWYAMLDEDVNGEDELGLEIDLKATYMIMDNLKLDLVAAYLFAGDATSLTGDNDEDPIEVGAQISLSF